MKFKVIPPTGDNKEGKYYLTHKEIENLCDEVICRQGWIRQKQGVTKEHSLFISFAPDRIYKKGEDLITLEIKPGNCSNGEMVRGLGQMMTHFPYQGKGYLVISEEQWEQLGPLARFFPWLGILVYNQKIKEDLTYDLWIGQKISLENTKDSWIPSTENWIKEVLQIFRC